MERVQRDLQKSETELQNSRTRLQQAEQAQEKARADVLDKQLEMEGLQVRYFSSILKSFSFKSVIRYFQAKLEQVNRELLGKSNECKSMIETFEREKGQLKTNVNSALIATRKLSL